MTKSTFLSEYKIHPIKNTERNFKLFEGNLMLFELASQGIIETALGAKANLATTAKVMSNVEPMSSETALRLLSATKNTLSKFTEEYNNSKEKVEDKLKIEFSNYLLEAYGFKVDDKSDLDPKRTLKNITSNSSIKMALHLIKLDLFLDGDVEDNFKNTLKKIAESSPKERFKSKQREIRDAVLYLGKILEQLPQDHEHETLINDIILELKGINLNMGNSGLGEGLDMDVNLRTAGRQTNKTLKTFWSIQNEVQSINNQKFKDFSKRHQKKTREFLDNANAGLGYRSMMKINKSFANLFEYNPMEIEWSKEDGEIFTKEQLQKAFVLKDPDDANNGLDEYERNYIKYFNEQVEKYVYNNLLSEEQKKDWDSDETIKRQLWPKGTVPLVYSSTNSDIWSSETRAETFKKMISALKKMRSNKKVGSDFEYGVMDLKYEFRDQLTIPGSPNSRHNMMGVDAEGKRDRDDALPLEYDLSLILNTFVSSNLFTQEAEEVFYIKNATMHALEIESKLYNDETSNDKAKSAKMKDALNRMYELYTKNVYKVEDSDSMAMIDQSNKLLSILALGLSPGQFLLELSTNSWQAISATLAQSMKGREKSRYNMEDWLYAGSMISGRLLNYSKLTDKIQSDKGLIAEQLVQFYGIYDSDPNLFKSYEFSESKKRFLWRSKWFFSANADE